MHADFSVELGHDDAALELPWSSDKPSVRYFDLKASPELVRQIPEAVAYPPLGVFLSRMNAAGFFLATAKCDAWHSQDISPEEEIFGADRKFVSYVDLVFVDEDARGSFAKHEDFAKELCRLLKHAPEISGSVELVIRRCYFHRYFPREELAVEDGGKQSTGKAREHGGGVSEGAREGGSVVSAVEAGESGGGVSECGSSAGSGGSYKNIGEAREDGGDGSGNAGRASESGGGENIVETHEDGGEIAAGGVGEDDGAQAVRETLQVADEQIAGGSECSKTLERLSASAQEGEESEQSQVGRSEAGRSEARRSEGGHESEVIQRLNVRGKASEGLRASAEEFCEETRTLPGESKTSRVESKTSPQESNKMRPPEDRNAPVSGFCFTAYVTGFGDSDHEPVRRWEIALVLLQHALVQLNRG